MATPAWSPGTLYQPGSLTRPRSGTPVVQSEPDNPSFEDDLTGWTERAEFGDDNWSIRTDRTFAGSKAAYWIGNGNGSGPKNSVWGILINDHKVPVTPGQKIRFSCRIARVTAPNHQTFTNGGARIYWYDADEVEIGHSVANKDGVFDTPAGMVGGGSGGEWRISQGIATAPPGAAFAAFAVVATGNGLGGGVWIDDCRWDYVFSGPPEGLIFRAIQEQSGFSGNTEPIWPVTVGATVVDNQVTWQAVLTSRIVWEATQILKSGDTEPDWPLVVGGTVPDGTIAWRAISRRIDDERCPHSTVVAIAASKVFAADKDIVAFSATVNPLDWSSANDAGFIPFGLQTYGSNPVAAMGLYRGNLVATNSEGAQMWQVDEDPQNMAILDAVPVGCTFHESMVPVQNDLVFVSSVGIRNIGIAGRSGNLQAGDFGKAVDPIVLEKIKQGLVPRSLFVPSLGQAWIFFGSEAIVLTINDGNQMSWSRYVFPEVIDDWAILGDDLYLRAGDLIWRVDEEALVDDEGGEDIEFEGEIWWPYLDLGRMGADKMLHGFDLVCTGEVTVSFGYDQSNAAIATPGYTLDGDTLPGEMIPMPITAPSIQLRLTFSGGQAWEWTSAVLYVDD